MTLELFLDVLKDAFIDSVKILPIILVVYFLIEFIETRGSSKDSLERAFTGKTAPLFGALIGVVPQCGFSVVATKLYQGKYILLGTLIAVYFATSDEAIPILFSHAITEPSSWGKLGLLLAIKVCYAILVGFILNAILKGSEISAFDSEAAEHAGEDGCCNHKVTSKRETLKNLLIHPLLHSLKIVFYIFIINFSFGILIDGLIGVDRLASFLSSAVFLQPLFSTLIGLIPNCASSVVITELFADGVISLGGAVAGLTVNSGLGIAILLKDRENVKRNLGIIALMFVLALFIGYLTAVIEVLI